MSSVSSSPIFTLIFLLGCGLIPAPKPWPSPVPRHSKQAVQENRIAEIFSRELEMRRARRTSSAISISPGIARLRPRDLYLTNGKTAVLSIPVEITNSSSRSIRMSLSHEWYGGIWPATDLYVAAQLSDAKGTIWATAPGYQVGEKGSAGSDTGLKPGEAKRFDIRLNWPGTGSVPAMPLIDESKPAKYSIRFLLFFKSGDSEEYVETQTFEVEVER